MGTFLIALALALITLLVLILEKTYFYVPAKELKRQAAHGEEPAQTLFRAATYGADLRILLWCLVVLGSAGSFFLFARVAPPLSGFLAIVILLWFSFAWIPRTRLTTIGVRLALWCTPVVIAILRWWHPVSRYILKYIGRYAVQPHTGLYDREDLFDMLDRQGMQGDNRIIPEDLDRVRQVLQINDYRVQDVMIPRKNVQTVNAQEHVNPVLVDSLHRSGHAWFPVYDGKPFHVVGVLSLDLIADIKHQGRILEYADERLTYLHERDSLTQALRAYYETRQHLFIVIDSHGVYVGIVTLGDILRHLFGAIEHEQFGRYDDKKAVQERHLQKHSENS